MFWMLLLGLVLGSVGTIATTVAILKKNPQLARAALEMVDPEGETNDRYQPYEPEHTIDSYPPARDTLL